MLTNSQKNTILCQTTFPYLEFVHPLELELLGIFLEYIQRGKVCHASMKAQRMVEHDERPHASLPKCPKGRSNR